jgi:threonyl-tRNA synthetase
LCLLQVNFIFLKNKERKIKMNINKELNKICSILLAKTIKDLYPDCTIGDAFIGDQLANESGFSYCFKLEKRLSITDLPMILKQMHKNIDRAFLITYKTISKKEALELFKDNKFKIELINDCTNDTIEIVSFGDEFNDICEKTSIAKLSAIKQIKLINIAGEY